MAFKQQLSLLQWWHITSQKDVNKMYETFLSIFLEIYETDFPYKQVTAKSKEVKHPWMSKALKNIIYSEAKIICEIFETENDRV